ncbi:YqcI/YcgG family protein [Actinopolyspora mortivallis]|uniref:YqcI/YcgG family protein n=1 Tax=Actinopolyspora mortivallis TaxID=33906 RepID=A0A2T0GSX6_ACTMO|nr:YqcI/YcgG family protein [Actinopolyspora mortivallis]PRW62197.1 YqcI/YcgG family protein [Actinopolyspora mortivallis]
MNTENGNRKLVSQDQVSAGAEGWHRDAFNDIAARLTSRDFPCIFSRNAFRKRILKFLFVEDITERGIRHLAEGLTEYVDISEEWDGNLDTSYPLVAAFSPDILGDRHSVADYHAFGWEVLQKLHEVDPAPWPEEIGKDPESGTWSMCFNGMPLFCNMSNPGHRARRSRNLGRHFTLVINPRERFDIFAGDTTSGRNVRSNIRNRVERYDGLPHSWQLGTYGSESLEWQQYGLLEENTERTDKCPFRFRGP